MKLTNDHQRKHSNYFGHNNRWKRYTPCLLLFLIMLTVQLFILTSKNSPISFINLSSLKYPWSKNSTTSTGPQHIFLLSYARSGSSFVGDLLQSMPNSFYYFEPMHFLSNSVLNQSFDEARTILDQLFNCQVSQVSGFTEWVKAHPSFMKFKRSVRYWKYCSANKSCYNSTVVDTYCRKQSSVIVKAIRLNLHEASLLFTTHPNLNLKIIYLMRDPRGTLNSRTKYPIDIWCKKQSVCSSSKKFCELLADDLEVMCDLLSTRPEAFIVIRYEDLAINPQLVANQLAQFLGQSSTVLPSMEAFLKSHTFVLGDVTEKSKRAGIAYAYTTFRNSSITATKWRQELNFNRVLEYQKDCKVILDALGYYSFSTIPAIRSNVNFDSDLQSALKTSCSELK